MFFGFPITTRIKTSDWYVRIHFEAARQSVVLNQGRSFSAKRLDTRMRGCDKVDYEKVKAGFIRLYFDNPSPDL